MHVMHINGKIMNIYKQIYKHYFQCLRICTALLVFINRL